MYAAFPSPVLPPGLPCTEVTPMAAQEPGLSYPSPASLDALAEHFLNGSGYRARTPAVPDAPCVLRSGGATADGNPDVAFDSTTLFNASTLAGAVLPPHVEPSLVIDHDGEGVLDQSKRSESFELVLPLSISTVNGAGRWASLVVQFLLHLTHGSQHHKVHIRTQARPKARARATPCGRAQ